MTMLDDDRLAALFARAGAAFDVPASGAAEILERAAGRVVADDGRDRGGDAEGPEDIDGGLGAGDNLVVGDLASDPRHLRRVAGLARRHRLLSVAACLVVLLALAGTLSAALVQSPTRRALSTAPLKVSAHTPAGAPTTTIAPRFGASGTTSQSQDATTPTTTPPLPNGAVGQPAKIQQTGSLGLTVGRGKVARTITQLTNLAAAYGGFVANSQSQSGAAAAGTPSGSVTLQVPVSNFATVLKRAQALGKTSDLTTKATDVTGQYVDLQSRIAALQETRQQYLTILAKATTVGDVLAVQEQVNGIQSQIEQLQGQLQLLAGQTSYSAVTVTVSEGAPSTQPRPSPLPESGLVRAWHASIGGFVTGVEGVIRLAGPVLFALLLVGVVLLGGRALWRRYQRHNL
jgi:hypothetical protein